jgi:hypothetical protein
MKKWATIEGYEQYAVSTEGDVKRISSGKLLKPQTTSKGYCTVRLYNQHGNKSMKVHRLVACAFIENKDNLPQVNHIDENKTNNRVCNLEWCDNQRNTTYGNTKKRISHKVRCIETGVVYGSIREAIRITSICGVGKCLRGKRKVSGGHHWERVIE